MKNGYNFDPSVRIPEMEEAFIVPSKFQLFGVTWSVIFDDDYLERKECYGESSYNERVIRLQRKSHGHDRNNYGIGHTFYHEVVHAILDSMNEHELSGNEKFVDLFGSLLHQFITSKQGNVLQS